MKKKSLLLLGILGFSIFYSALCFQLCPSVNHDLGFMQDANCSSFLTYVGTGLSVLFSLALVGLFLLINTAFTPEGFVLLPFKPPRYHA